MRDLKIALALLSQVYQKPGVAGVAGVADNDINKLAATPLIRLLKVLWAEKYFNNNRLQTHATPATPQHQKNSEAGKFPAVATIATFQDFEKEFDRFQNGWSQGQPKWRKDQACWCAELFLRDWGQLAVEFGWTPDDIFASIGGARRGLAWWLAADGTDVIRALGPEHAVTEDGSRIYDRVTRCSWVRP
jgi:hypothetical protein